MKHWLGSRQLIGMFNEYCINCFKVLSLLYLKSQLQRTVKLSSTDNSFSKYLYHLDSSLLENLDRSVIIVLCIVSTRPFHLVNRVVTFRSSIPCFVHYFVNSLVVKIFYSVYANCKQKRGLLIQIFCLYLGSLLTSGTAVDKGTLFRNCG